MLFDSDPSLKGLQSVRQLTFSNISDWVTRAKQNVTWSLRMRSVSVKAHVSYGGEIREEGFVDKKSVNLDILLCRYENKRCNILYWGKGQECLPTTLGCVVT